MDQIFRAANLFALVGWVLIVVAPRWRLTERLVLSGLWSVILAIVYSALIVLNISGSDGGFGSIEDVRRLFASDALLTAGWVHYLAFDLYAGASEVRQAQTANIPHLVLIPILLATFLFGPMGLLLFFIVKSMRQRRVADVIP